MKNILNNLIFKYKNKILLFKKTLIFLFLIKFIIYINIYKYFFYFKKKYKNYLYNNSFNLIKYNNKNNNNLFKNIKSNNEFFIRNNIDDNDLINLLNKFPKLNFIKKNNTIINLFNKKNIKRLIWNISYEEKIIYDYINNDFIEIYVKKINNLNFFLFNLNIDKNFSKNIINFDTNENDINNIINIINKYEKFDKINEKNKCILLLHICKNNICNHNLNKLIGIKFFINKKKYYIIRDLYRNFYDLNIIKKYFIKFPVNGKFRISSKFNLYRLNPITNQISPHKGIDIAIPIGTPILSADDGIIEKISFNKYAGKYIIIKHGKKYFTKYMHLKKILVNINKKINKGDLIALSGNSGKSTGPHLHFELWINNKAINPIFIDFSFIKNKKFLYKIDYIKDIMINYIK